MGEKTTTEGREGGTIRILKQGVKAECFSRTWVRGSRGEVERRVKQYVEVVRFSRTRVRGSKGQMEETTADVKTKFCRIE